MELNAWDPMWSSPKKPMDYRRIPKWPGRILDAERKSGKAILIVLSFNLPLIFPTLRQKAYENATEPAKIGDIELQWIFHW